MKAFLWKRLLTIKDSKVRLYLFLLIPPMYFFFIQSKVNIDNIIAYFPLICTLFLSLVHWNVEDLIYSENIIATILNKKIIWKSNFIFIVFSGYIYSTIIMCLGLLILKLVFGNNISINILPCIQYIVSIFIAVVIISLSTIYYCDFSKTKQYFSSIFSISNLLSLLIFYYFGNRISISIVNIVISLIISVILFIIANRLVNLSSNETLIRNIQLLSDGYTNNVLNE